MIFIDRIRKKQLDFLGHIKRKVCLENKTLITFILKASETEEGDGSSF